ncbi:MAG: transposase [Rhodospirillales bacterium]|nr:transposase [Rhodospirillales bacterium]
MVLTHETGPAGAQVFERCEALRRGWCHEQKRYTVERIAFALSQVESGTAVAETCRKLGVSEPTFYRWKKQFAGMGTVEIRRLKQLEWAISFLECFPSCRSPLPWRELRGLPRCPAAKAAGELKEILLPPETPH